MPLVAPVMIAYLAVDHAHGVVSFRLPQPRHGSGMGANQRPSPRTRQQRYLEIGGASSFQLAA
mgnify:CR=1 FL=1